MPSVVAPAAEPPKARSPPWRLTRPPTAVPRRLSRLVPALSSRSVPPVFTLNVDPAARLETKALPAPEYVRAPPLTESAPNEPVEGWAAVRVSVPAPILLISGKDASLKRMKRPAKVVLASLKPTFSVGVPSALKTSPEPARPPHVVFR